MADNSANSPAHNTRSRTRQPGSREETPMRSREATPMSSRESTTERTPERYYEREVDRTTFCTRNNQPASIWTCIFFIAPAIIAYVWHSHPEVCDMRGNLQSDPGDDVNGDKEAAPDVPPELAKQIKFVIADELEKYSADKTGKIDFALENSGGKIMNTRDTELFTGCYGISVFGYEMCQPGNSPRALIQASMLPGQCWAFKGSKGAIVIKLIEKIYVTGVTLEHISANISPTGHIKTAPKEFSVWGLKCPEETDGFKFGKFDYRINGPTIQYFPVQQEIPKKFDFIEFQVDSNHGDPDYTCVYRLVTAILIAPIRLRVHGRTNEEEEKTNKKKETKPF